MLILLSALVGGADAKRPHPAEGPVATVGAPAQPEETVEMPCGYVVGETHRYQLETESIRRVPGQPPATQGNRVDVALTVVAHEPARTLLDVTFDAPRMLPPPNDPVLRGLLERVGEASSGVPVRIEVDHAVSVARIVDLDALMHAFAGLAASLRSELPPALAPSVEAALADREAAAAAVTDDLQPLFGFTCGRVPVGTVHYETALPNPLGRTPLPASGTLSGVVAADVATFSVHETLDPVRVMDHLRPIVAQAGGQRPERADFGALQVEIRTDVEVVVDRVTGWPTRWSSARTGSALGSSRTDRVAGMRR